MKVLVLAAGYATRLYPLTKDRPKPLLPVWGRPLLSHVVDTLQTMPSFEELWIVTNSRFAPHFHRWAAREQHRRVPIEVLDDGTHTVEGRLGAVGDLAFAIHRLGIPDRGLFVCAGDNLIRFDLAAAARAYASREESTIVVLEEHDLAKRQRTGVVSLDPATDQITSFQEKPQQPETAWVSPPFYFFSPRSLERVPEYLALEEISGDAPGHFVGWLAAQSRIYGAPVAGTRVDIGNLEQYEAVNARTPRVHLLGTGGALSSRRRGNTSIALSLGDELLLVDCSGNPVQQLEAAGLDWAGGLGDVLLTHHHPDHVGGLISLVHQLRIAACKPRRQLPLRIWGGARTLDRARALLDAAGLLRDDDVLRIDLRLVPDEGGAVRRGEAFPVRHGHVPTLGYQLELEGRTVVLSADTEPCDEVRERARSAALLIHECSHLEAAPTSVPGHTTLPALMTLVSQLPESTMVRLVHLPPATAEEEERVAATLADRFGDRVRLGVEGETVVL